MALFRPYERKESTDSTDQISALTPKGRKAEEKARKAASTPAATQAPATEAAPSEKIRVPRKKVTPTPSRKQAQAARMDRLHPQLTPKEQRKADRTARQQSQANAWEKQENSPERALLRNYVDARWTVAEFMMPAMILVMAAVMATMNFPVLSSWIALSLWVLLAITIINVGIMWRGFKKLLAERHPSASTKGLLVYMFNRSLMLRRFRQPGAVIKRGDDY